VAVVFDVVSTTIGTRLFRARLVLRNGLGGATTGVDGDAAFDRWARDAAPRR
jgi:hypothetical protein